MICFATKKWFIAFIVKAFCLHEALIESTEDCFFNKTNLAVGTMACDFPAS